MATSCGFESHRRHEYKLFLAQGFVFLSSLILLLYVLIATPHKKYKQIVYFSIDNYKLIVYIGKVNFEFTQRQREGGEAMRLCTNWPLCYVVGSLLHQNGRGIDEGETKSRLPFTGEAKRRDHLASGVAILCNQCSHTWKGGHPARWEYRIFRHWMHIRRHRHLQDSWGNGIFGSGKA